MRTYNDGIYKRISKRDAEKRYYAGQTIYILPCKIIPGNIGFPLIGIDIKSCDFNTWEHVTNEATYYNCNRDIGYYLSYYIKTEVQ